MKSKIIVYDCGKLESFCLFIYYFFDGVDVLYLLICNIIMNNKFIMFVIYDIFVYDCF